MHNSDPSAAQAALKARQADFLKLCFGMFIHFNMATYQGVEWVEGYPHPAAFHPGARIDTGAWADAAVSSTARSTVSRFPRRGPFCDQDEG